MCMRQRIFCSPVHDAIQYVGEGTLGFESLDEGDLDPVVGLNVEHLDPVSSDREAAIILGYGPGDVDLVSHAVLILRPASGEMEKY